MRLFLLLTIILLATQFANAAKSDTVTLYNGDRITCEVKSLSKGKLYIKTDDMGKIYIKWTEVAHIETLGQYDITLKDHSEYFGKFSKSSEGKALVSFGIFEQVMPLIEITTLTKINTKFWKQVSGNIDGGFSFSQGSQNLQFNSNGNISHRTRKFLNSLSYDAVISENPQTKTQKQNAGYTLTAFFKHSYFGVFNLSWEQNTELGIANRVLTNVRIGYPPIDNSINRLDISAGLLQNREFSSEQEATNNTEGIVDITYNLFIFTKPDIDITTILTAYPSFTVKNRIRSNFDFRVRWKVFSNFTLNLSYYFNYDNKPPSVDALQFDYNINTSIGYTF